MDLNTEKIELELKRIDRTKYWLANQIGRSPQLVLYWMKYKSIKGAEPIAEFFGLSPKDLIK